jgi:hypothetical protein
MSLLHLHTQLFEMMDWDEEAVEEALKRTVELSKELSSDGVNVSTIKLKNSLENEYNKDIAKLLLDFFQIASGFEKQFEEDYEDIQ